MAWHGNRLRRWWSIAERAVGAPGVVVMEPGFDQDPGLRQGVEDLSVEQLVTELAVEGFVVAVLPGTVLLDVERTHADPGQPVLDDVGDELGALVGADVLRRAMVVRSGAKSLLTGVSVASTRK
jgi:hypothetical protein